MIQTEICILGAGPAGTSAALHLSYLEISSVIIDKAIFPRDKTCGDALSGKVQLLLERLDPEILDRFRKRIDIQTEVWGLRFAAPNGKMLDLPIKRGYNKETDEAPGHVAKRVDFDNFLIEELKLRDNISLHQNTEIAKIEELKNGFVLSNKDASFQVNCKLLLVADGAHSQFSRHFVGHKKDPAHHAGALRAYYENVTGFHEDDFIELHFIKAINPGYFWVFPLPNGRANVGLGMRSDFISKRKVNLKKTMLDIIENHPEISPRFKNAKLESKIIGYGLPLGSKKRQLSGDNFMLLGDAGHLIDPLTGEGIGNGFYSGWIAAEQAQKCLEANDFSAKFLKDYDVRIRRVLGKEMQLSYQLQRIMKYTWIVNPIVNWIERNQRFLDTLTEMYNDLELRRQLVNPIFWLKRMIKGNG